MKKRLLTILALALAIFMAAGCSSPKEKQGGEKASVKVALLLPGEVTDGGWNAEAHEGLLRLEQEFGAKISYMEHVEQSDMQEAMRNYAVEKYDYIIGHGFQFADSMFAVATEFPDTRFIVNSATVFQEPNVASCNVDNKQQGFLAGVFAAKMTETGVIGGISSIEIPSLVNYILGAEIGAKYVNPDIKYLSAWTGSSTDVAKAKELSKALVDQGADVLLPYASQGDNGVYETARETGSICVGVISDRHADAPDQIPTSIRCKIGDADFGLIRDLVNGDIDWKAGVYDMGVKEGIVGYYDLQGKWLQEVPAEVWEYCKKVEKAIAEGVINIDDTTVDNVHLLPDV